MLALLLGACGGAGDEPHESVDSTGSVAIGRSPATTSSAVDDGAGTASERTESDADQRSAEPSAAARLTDVPDACELLTPADAAELLDGSVDAGRSADISGLGNCAYGTDTGERLSLVVQLGGDDRIESTQFAMSLEHCGTRLAARPERLGVGSALYDRPREPCGGGFVLWVATGVSFEGKTHPELVRIVSGRIHLLLARSPAPEPEEARLVLRAAAERVLNRLTGRPSSSQ